MNAQKEDLVGKWVIVKNDEIVEQDESLEKIYLLAKNYNSDEIIEFQFEYGYDDNQKSKLRNAINFILGRQMREPSGL